MLPMGRGVQLGSASGALGCWAWSKEQPKHCVGMACFPVELWSSFFHPMSRRRARPSGRVVCQGWLFMSGKCERHTQAGHTNYQLQLLLLAQFAQRLEVPIPRILSSILCPFQEALHAAQKLQRVSSTTVVLRHSLPSLRALCMCSQRLFQAPYYPARPTF